MKHAETLQIAVFGAETYIYDMNGVTVPLFV